MKILLVGEYSGFHNALKEGLLKLGHEVVLLAHEDGFKKFGSDIGWKTNQSGFMDKFKTIYNLNAEIIKLKNFDVVQFINQSVFQEKFGINEYLINKLIKNNDKSFLIAAGDDCIVWDYWKDSSKNNIKYSWIEEGVGYDYKELGKGKNFHELDKKINWNYELAHKVNGVIPILYEYEIPYKKLGFSNLKPLLPIPINVDKIIYKENIVSKRPLVFHGLNRYGVKGTKHINEAFTALNKKYPNKIDFEIAGKMSQSEYLNFIEKVNISLDQTNSYSLAVNALINMAMGKVVLGGVEKEFLNAMNFTICPALNIIPNSLQIQEQLESLMFDFKKIENIGLQSRIFVEKNYNYIDVANKYLKIWKES